MTTPATRTVSSDMHWAAWLSLIFAVLGIWLLVEITTFPTKAPLDETRYPISQHDFLAQTPPPVETPAVEIPAAETEGIPEEALTTDVHPEALEKADADLEGETTLHTTPLPTDEIPPDADSQTAQANSTLQSETTVAMIDPALPANPGATDSSEVQASLPDTNAMAETPADPAARYVTVWTGNIRREPNNQSAALFQLRWGQKVKVLDDQGRWNQIEASDGQRGWGHKTLFGDTPPSLEAIAGLKGMVETIRVQMDGARACTVFIDLDGNQPPQTQVLEGESPRLVSDFPLMMADPKIAPTISVHNGVINSIRVGITDEANLTTRVVVDLIPGVDYVVDQVFYQEEQTYALHIKAKEV